MKSPRLEVLFSPAEFLALGARDLRGVTCVVFDILRATTSIVTALERGAAAVLPVGTIEEALAVRERNPNVLLAGERDGVRIRGALSGGVEFDFGNSPREFLQAELEGRTLVMTTTNGTRALEACEGADSVLVGCFLNLETVAKFLIRRRARQVLLVCSGTHEEASYEDTLAAGALVDLLGAEFSAEQSADSCSVARTAYLTWKNDLLGAMKWAQNGRRLLGMSDLAGDVPYCLQRDTIPLLASLSRGRVVRLS